MIPQEHRIIAALGQLGAHVVPENSVVRRHVFETRAHERDIQEALAAAGLPALAWPGRRIFTMPFRTAAAEDSIGISSATGHWARIWCRALGLPHRSAWDRDVIVDPTTGERSTMTAHDRIQLLREEQAVARNLAARRASAPSGTDILSDPGVMP